ncbi:MAG: hypothetical protein HQ472_10785 [Ignavibacteria bacterium]|nr:hypothetical protein [Ignavibacteria bacterium]
MWIVCTQGALIAQNCNPGAINGNLIGQRLRITDANNACGCGNNYALPYTLHLLESEQPSLRFSSNGPALNDVCLGDFHTTMSLFRGGFQNTHLEGLNDFSIAVGVSDSTTANLILTTRDPGSMIKFATTPPLSSEDFERMRIIDIGHVGIASTDPKEFLQIGPRMTFHVGSFNDFFGYNTYIDGGYSQKRINSGYSSKLDFASNGAVRLGLGGTGSADASVNFQEPSGTFNGLSMYYDGNGNGVYAFGLTTPESATRLAIRSQGNTSSTNALRITNSSNVQLLQVLNDGAVYIGSATPHNLLTGAALQVEGNVVIGDKLVEESVPFDFKLHVNGIIFARELLILSTNEWSDHVFKPEYELRSLEDLNEFIVENGHLPNVPSEADVKENGVSVSEFQRAILEKVEELTLYVLQLSNENKQLRSELHTIKESLK